MADLRDAMTPKEIGGREVRLGARRQLTLPAEMCRALGIQVGERLELSVADGALVARPEKAHGEIRIVISRQVMEELIGVIRRKQPDPLPVLDRLLTGARPEVCADPTPKEIDEARHSPVGVGQLAWRSHAGQGE
jgi:bifunctional DNA-binding transcriptional regulator/antitoxin component of YhaV-PrlF toxin-antitoxin module